jgi:glutamine synthetase
VLSFAAFDEAAAFLRAREIAMVDLKFCDLWGRWHHVTLPVKRFQPWLLERGVGFDGSALGFKPVKAGDMLLVPDLEAAFLDPWCEVPTLSFICQTYEASTTRELFPYDPRNIAHRAEEHLRASGIADRSVWGPEFEFYLFDGVAFENTVNIASYRIESSEGAWRARELGSGYTVPLRGEAGSGMHFHQCLWKGDANVFYDPDGYARLSGIARQYIAGLLLHGGAVMALSNPSTNSYRRLVPGFEAPVSAFFSAGNRSAAIRVPKYADKPESTRFEFRPPDATGNPYLSVAAQLLAGLDGIRRRLDPTQLGFGPVDDDIFTWSAERRASIRALPTSLGQALDALEADHTFLFEGDVFSADLIERWLAKKRAEERDVLGRPHPYEVELYYDL